MAPFETKYAFFENDLPSDFRTIQKLKRWLLQACEERMKKSRFTEEQMVSILLILFSNSGPCCQLLSAVSAGSLFSPR